MRPRDRVWALAALQAVVTLSWMAYAHHQPLLLARFGFQTLADILSWYLVLAGTTLAPLAGDASDRLVRSGGERFPIVRAGVGLAVASFIAVAVTARAEGDSAVRFVLPLFVAIWIAGMTVFQAPALAMLRDASGESLPREATPVVIATTLPIAAWPFVEASLDRLGGSLTFLVGGVAVAGTALALGATAPAVRAAAVASSGRPAMRSLADAFAAGVASAVVAMIASDTVPGMLAARTSVLGTGGFAAVAGLIATVATGFAARMTARFGGRALLVSLVVALVCQWMAGLSVGTARAVGIAIVAGLAMAFALVTALPLVLSAQPSGRAGLLTGLYVGGVIAGIRLLPPFLAAL